MANLFANQGYEANSYHTLDGKYYNREVVHKLWGYEAFHDQDDLGFVGEPTCDTTLMEAYEYLVSHEKPFFDYIITYSGHGPYTEKRQVIAENHLEIAQQLAIESGVVCENEDTWNQYVRAIAHVRETDAMIGQLIENMTADGTIHNTTLVFFGDHYSKYLTDTDFIMQLKGVEDMYSICRTPFFIYSEKLEPASVEKVTSSVDMLPTIANLFDLAINPRYSIGNDAFSEKGGFVCFKDFSWIDSEHRWTPDYEGEMTPEMEARCEEVRALLNASWDTVKSNYFEYLLNPPKELKK
jgi:lipoteichoic acid synthase